MANRDVVAIGTSAGGIEALLFLAEHFPPAFPAAILVTIHLPSHSHSSLDDILTGAGPLPASFAKHGDAVKHGRIYIAPPGRHLLIDGGALSLGVGPRENNVRPSIDPMLRSAALCCGGRTVGVVLTGTMGDGASGLWAVNQCGGTTVIQDPRDAAFPEMPLTALNRAIPKHIAKLADMPALLQKLVHQPAGEALPCPANMKYEVEIARSGHYSMDKMDRIGRRSVLSCPDCNGVMWEMDEGDLIRYRCHVGHAYTGETISVAMDDNLRRALGSALRVLDERIAVSEKLRNDAAQRGHTQVADNWATKKQEFEAEARIIREAVERADELAVADDSGLR